MVRPKSKVSAQKRARMDQYAARWRAYALQDLARYRSGEHPIGRGARLRIAIRRLDACRDVLADEERELLAWADAQPESVPPGAGRKRCLLRRATAGLTTEQLEKLAAHPDWYSVWERAQEEAGQG